MNKETFYSFLSHPEQLNEQSLLLLEELLRAFPYFQAARLLYIKNLNLLGHHNFNTELKVAAAQIPNRKAIYFFIHPSEFVPLKMETNAHSAKVRKQVSENADSESVKTKLKVFPKLNKEKKYSERMRSKLLLLVSEKDKIGLDYFDQLAIAPNPSHNYLEAFLNDQEVLENNFFDLKSSHPASEEMKPDLIDRFILNAPKITTGKPVVSKTDSHRDEEIGQDGDDLMTDTLARIYLSQGHYEKARIAYEKLSLNYPEKSVYFARQLKKIEELKNRSKA